MSDDLGAVRRGFRKLLAFGGRDTPAQFWPFAGAVLGAMFVVGNGLFVVLASVGAATASRETAEPADVLIGVGMPSFLPLVVLMAVVAMAAALLLAAAVTRRLHDRDHRGGWAGIPLVLVGTGLVMFAFVTRDFERSSDPDATLFFLAFANNVVYFVTLALLTWQLIRSGTAGENRFGAPTTD
jgi:uncharacterized membrane protein YhaH (DUF805 family)